MLAANPPAVLRHFNDAHRKEDVLKHPVRFRIFGSDASQENEERRFVFHCVDNPPFSLL